MIQSSTVENSCGDSKKPCLTPYCTANQGIAIKKDTACELAERDVSLFGGGGGGGGAATILGEGS